MGRNPVCATRAFARGAQLRHPESSHDACVVMNENAMPRDLFRDAAALAMHEWLVLVSPVPFPSGTFGMHVHTGVLRAQEAGILKTVGGTLLGFETPKRSVARCYFLRAAGKTLYLAFYSSASLLLLHPSPHQCTHCTGVQGYLAHKKQF